MKVFIMGARGFIGARVANALEAAGHDVVRGSRPQFDFARDHDAATWQAKLRGFDAVVNAVGIFREHGAQTFEAIHVRGPIAMFRACAALGIPVIQFSALGADEGAQTQFHRSKRRADDALLDLDVPSVVLQPSLVHGAGGASAALFTTLASLPVIPLPGGGGQRVQPVHVDDAAAAVVAIVDERRFTRDRVALVGPRAMTLREFLGDLRAAMGFHAARFISVPAALVTFAAKMRMAGMLDADAWSMLRRGNTGDAAALTALLHRAPRASSRFIATTERDSTRREAQLGWLLPLLRLSLAIMWIAAGIVSAGLYPREDSLALLARTGLTGSAAHAALYGASLLDLALGVATLVMRRRRLLWLAQMALIVGYTAIITVALPEQWLHPYGPVVKNLPVLAAILLLYTLEGR